MIKLRRCILAVGGLCCVASCSIRPDSSPSDVPDDQRGGFGAELATGGEAAGTSQIFLVATPEANEPAQLRSVLRDVPVPNKSAAVLRSLLSGPNSTEQAADLGTALPADLEILSVRTLGRITTIDINDALDALDAVELRLALAQLVNTATAVDDVDAVEIRVNGESQFWPRGDGELTDETLTIYDFPGVVESTQPDFPSFPSSG